MAHRMIASTRFMQRSLQSALVSNPALRRQLHQNLLLSRSSIAANTTLTQILDAWKMFCEKPPKGFEKYFRPGGSPKQSAASEDEANKKKDKGESMGKRSGTSGDTQKPESQQNDWNFGMFSPNQQKRGGGGSGRPIGGEGGDREKWLILGAIGTVAFLGALAYMDMGYKEIGWKEFVNRMPHPF